MADDQRIEEAGNTGPKRRPTIGLAMDNLHGATEYHNTLWNGIVDAARERDADLIAFAGGALRFSPQNEFEGERNVIYGLMSADNVDGIILTSTTMSNFVTSEEFRDFYTRYHPLPMVSIGLSLEGIPSLLINNEKGLRDAIVHLIERHGHRRIAFISGVKDNENAEQRYRTYTNVLAEYDIPLDLELVAPGLFLHRSGVEAVRLFLDERKVDFEAIVAANDSMAIGAMEELQARGITVPYDVAVVGFDALTQSRYTIPPLTTVRQPIYEQGKLAVETLLALLAGEEVPEQTYLSTGLIVRQSCGCILRKVALQTPAKAETAATAEETWESALAAQREHILSEIAQVVSSPDWPAQLLDAFSAALKDTGDADAFLQALDSILRQATAQGHDTAPWQDAISILRNHALPLLTDQEILHKATVLWERARVLIADMEQRVQALQVQREKEQSEMLRDVNQALLATLDLQALGDMVTQQLPRLGIKGCYISLYEPGSGTPTHAPHRSAQDASTRWRLKPPPSEWSRMVIAYDENGRIEPEDEGRFPARQLVPDGLLSGETRHHIVLEGLNIRDEQIGFILFEMGPTEGLVYETLRAQISGALKGALLAKETEERSRALQEANYALQRRAIELEASATVGRAITSIFDLDELLLQTVELIRDRFGFYHAGIFLIDETKEWAVLQEATGEAGAQMKAQNHRLAVSDTSMVGWTAAHRQPRIALYAGEDDVRFANPLLPYTRSEMTLPLMVGEQLLGVLNVQSTEEAAFDQDDVRALQSMADQVAIAIENAQRVSDEAALLEATSPIYRASRLLTTATTTKEVADAIIASVAETGADGCTVVEFEFSSSGEPEALLYLGVWRQDREPQFHAGMRLPISESPFPLEMVSSMWAVADVEQDERLPRSARIVFQATGARALANVPLRSGEQVIGQVVVIRAKPGPFPGTAMRLYEVLSDQAAVALERAKLLEETQRRAEREQSARRMIDHIRQAVNIEQALQTAAEELCRALEVPHVSIELSPEATMQE